MRRRRIVLREAGFIGPIVALVPSLQKFDDSIVNTIDGGYGRGYDGYLEEPLEQGRLAAMARYYCQADITLDNVKTQKILYSPLIVNHQPRMVLLPADYRSACRDEFLGLFPVHKAAAAGAFSLSLHYTREERLLFDDLKLSMVPFRNDPGFHGFVVPTRAFREVDRSEVGWQMVYVTAITDGYEAFGFLEATLPVNVASRVQLHPLTTSETLDVNLSLKCEIDKRCTFHLSSKRMSECQVESLEISRICTRRIIEWYTQNYNQNEPRSLINFFAGTGMKEHGARYLVTGYRTYLDPKITIRSKLRGYDRPILFEYVGDKVGAMQLCEVSIDINNVTQPSEADIDFRNMSPKDLDSLQIHVGKPKWYVLCGPKSDQDGVWPPSITNRRHYMEEEVGDTYKMVDNISLAEFS